MDGLNFFGIGSTELLVVALLAVVVLGPERLVRTARELGKLIRNLKEYFGSFSEELKTELEILDEVKGVKDDIAKSIKKM